MKTTPETLATFKLFLNPHNNIDPTNYPDKLKELIIERITEIYGTLNENQKNDILTQAFFRGKHNRKYFYEYKKIKDGHQTNGKLHSDIYDIVIYNLEPF